MAKIEKRIERLEAKRDAMAGDLYLLTDEELENRFDAVLTRMGTNRERVIAEHGSLGAFSHWFMCNPSDSANHKMNDGRTANEKYMMMLG